MYSTEARDSGSGAPYWPGRRLVIGETADAAKDGAEAVVIDYAPFPVKRCRQRTRSLG